MRTIKKTQMGEIINECKSYISECNAEEQNKYNAELESCGSDFSKLMNSGIFHDAIGKVVRVESDTIIVTDEY